MSTPHLIPLAQALDLIHAAVAVQIDGSYVTYPTYPIDPDDDGGFCLVCARDIDMDEAEMDRFRAADNAQVEVTADGFVMVDTRGSHCVVVPLMAAPLPGNPERYADLIRS